MLVEESKVKEVKGISEIQKADIITFLTKAIDSWCNSKSEEWFSARDFLGGKNRNWQGTPMQALYTKYINKGLSDAESKKRAGHDAGWLLKKTIKQDLRWFNTQKTPSIRIYQWTGE